MPQDTLLDDVLDTSSDVAIGEIATDGPSFDPLAQADMEDEDISADDSDEEFDDDFDDDDDDDLWDDDEDDDEFLDDDDDEDEFFDDDEDEDF